MNQCHEPHTHQHIKTVSIEFSTNCFIFWKECDCGHRILNGDKDRDTEKLADIQNDELHGFIHSEENHGT